MNIMVTGGAGFIGHHFVNHFAQTHKVTVVDHLNYAGSLDRLRAIGATSNPNVFILACPLSETGNVNILHELMDIEYIFHLAAETHVDRSITDASPFVTSNVMGTMHLLETARKLPRLKCFFYFSTDEVFGPAPVGTDYSEDDTHNPRNPYAATKSGGEMLVKAYANTYGLPTVITRTMNAFGPRQHPEKYVPTIISKVLGGDTLHIHSNPSKTKAGSRFYIYAPIIAQAYNFLLVHHQVGDTYHIVGEREFDNLELAQVIADQLGKPLKYELVDFHSSRPGHDLRYALSGEKLQAMGWSSPIPVIDSLHETVQWYLDHPEYLGA
jgi:dTDP-glucose 4,6-dehydratase